MIDRSKSELGSGFFEITSIKFGACSITVNLKQHGGKLCVSAYINDDVEVRMLFMALRLSYAYKVDSFPVFDLCIGAMGTSGFIVFNVVEPRDVTDNVSLDEPERYELNENGSNYYFKVDVEMLDIEKGEEGKENG